MAEEKKDILDKKEQKTKPAKIKKKYFKWYCLR